ncbi:hypothetical protein [Litorimonas haliclonae]|uniref:hypothetical protein n=1 Tax=Litorimonas haliclonae TaxID=2081977 RepID=UPI0039EECECC
MFAISYKFALSTPTPENEKKFAECWKGVTQFFQNNAGALGSRLHKGEDGAFYAYAEWPDKATFEASQQVLPTEDFVKTRLVWAEICEPSEILWAGEVVADLLKS